MANWQNGVTPINEDNLNALYDLRRGSNVIASNTDLNDLTTAGTYRCDSSTIATTLVNCPVSSGFKMAVDYTVGTNTFIQTIIMNNSNADIWVRNKSANSWADWHQIATTDNSYYLGVGKPITSGTDLNNITTIGTYYSITIEITNSLLNCPVKDTGFKLIVENTTGTNRVVQTIRVNNANTSAIYVRTYTGSWGEWNIVMTGNYSTSEQRIGTWIDTKPLYRKIFTSSSFESTYNTGITNISEIVDFRGLVYRKDFPNMIHPIPSRFKRSGYEIDLESLAKNSGGLQVAITWGSSYDSTKVSRVVFIIEYTKTTD